MKYQQYFFMYIYIYIYKKRSKSLDIKFPLDGLGMFGASCQVYKPYGFRAMHFVLRFLAFLLAYGAGLLEGSKKTRQLRYVGVELPILMFGFHLAVGSRLNNPHERSNVDFKWIVVHLSSHAQRTNAFLSML